MTFRVFSGWDKRQAEAAEVFRFSVLDHASIPVEVHFISAEDTPTSVAACKRRGVTSFSYARFMSVHASGFTGRACYGDGCDQLCLGDVRELAEWDMQGKAIWVVKHPSLPGQRGLRARSWTSLLLMDCGHPKLRRWTPEYVERAADDTLMRLSDFADDEIGSLPGEWNLLMPADMPGSRKLAEVPGAGNKMLHWSYLSDPNGNSWVDRSGSALWAEWRERWRASR
jgi:hypothetical protein